MQLTEILFFSKTVTFICVEYRDNMCVHLPTLA